MTLSEKSMFRWVAVGLVTLSCIACGNSDLVGNPPGGGGFTPGPPGDGNGTGYSTSSGANGTGGTGGDPGPPDCVEAERRCLHEFTFQSQGGEQTVEVHGDFAPDGWTTGVPMALANGEWAADVDIAWNTPVQYKFVVDGVWMTDPANPNTIPDGYGGQNSLLAGETCEVWTCEAPVVGNYDWRDAIMYFVFVDRFNDGKSANNGQPVSGVETPANYQGGDWAGVTAKIDAGYFTDLGVNTLWLTVPLDNTDQAGLGSDGHQYSAYHGYWPRNLDQPEARFGTLPELQALVDAAHAKDIKVILDYAMNHVHITSPVYQQHQDWFWPIQNGNQYCVCGAGCPWDGPDAKRCWFTDYLPDFNFTVQAARDYSVGNAMSWITQTGIDGFRLDAVKHIEDSWLLQLRQRVTAEIEPGSGQHFYMVGETYTGDRNLIKYYVNQSMLDGQFDFPMRAALISSLLTRSATMNDLDGFIQGNIGFYGTGVMSTFIGNHDVPRTIHYAQDNPLWGDVWANGKDKAWSGQPGLPSGMSAFERFANAYAVLFTVPGVPLVYYGDEIGLPGAGDPDNRRFMQWSGYSAGQLFLRDRVTTLAHVRAAHAALRRGSRTTLSVNADTMAYRMSEGGDQVIVIINRADSQTSVGSIPAGNYLDELSGNTVSGPNVTMPARSARVLTPQ